MPGVPPSGQGWLRDQPDFRDLTPATPSIRELFAKLKRRRAGRGSKPPAAVDLTEYLVPSPPAGERRSTVDATLAILQYFERRASGQVLEGSESFLEYNSRRLSETPSGGGLSLRTALRAVARFGSLPRRYERIAAAGAAYEPTPFDYGFQGEFAGMSYVRLDPPGRSGDEVLRTVKSFIAAGFACLCGALLGSAPAVDGDFPFPTNADAITGGTALMVAGYDDNYRIRSSHGALLVRTSFGSEFGRGGVGRLPYRFVEEGLACDFWTLVKPSWQAVGEFEQPAETAGGK